MANHNTAPRWWLLLIRGPVYLLIGAFIFMIANAYTAQSGLIVGALLTLAGLGQLGFSLTNRGADSNNIWGFMYSTADIVFGLAICVFANKTQADFTDTLGFWAMIYAFLQAVQAMYASMAARSGTGVHLSSSVVRFASVLTMGAMAYGLLFIDSLSFAGVLLFVFGGLTIVLTQQSRAQAANTQPSPRVG